MIPSTAAVLVLASLLFCYHSHVLNQFQLHHSPPPHLRLILQVMVRTRILKRIPNASGDQASARLTATLEEVVCSNNSVSWERLLWFPSRCLGVPLRCGRRQSLATQINKQLREEVDSPENMSIPNKMRAKENDPLESLG